VHICIMAEKHPKPTNNSAKSIDRWDDEGGAPSGGRHTPEVELRPDGGERVETAISAAVKTGPKHRPAKHPVAQRRRRARKTK
jgi:hypothetical protein